MPITEEQKEYFKNKFTGANLEKDPKDRVLDIVSNVSKEIPDKNNTFFGNVKSFGKGVLKGIGSTLYETPKMLETAGQGVLAAVDPTKKFSDIQKETGLEIFKPEKAEQIREVLKADNTAEKAGKLTEFLAEILIPTSIVTGVAGKGKKIIQEGLETGLNKSKSLVSTGVEKGTEIFTGKAPSIVETISPKINAAETRNLIREGRITQPKSSIIFGKQPDIITPSEKLTKSAELIKNNIPNATKMNAFELSNAIGNKTTEIATKLKPQLKTVPVTPDTTNRMVNAWEKVKVSQASNPEFVAFKGSKTAQKNFEAYLNELKKAYKGADGKFRQKDLNDVWELRKKYDSTIPESVKKATSQSAPSTQLQHDMWLQNRELLNEVIEEMSESLDDVAKKSFEEMNLLYSARNNIINKAKVDVTGKSGIYNTKNILKAGAGLIGAKFLLFD